MYNNVVFYNNYLIHVLIEVRNVRHIFQCKFMDNSKTIGKFKIVSFGKITLSSYFQACF